MRKRTDWEEIQKVYDSGKSQAELHKIFGVASQSLIDAQKRGEFKSRTRSEALKLTIKLHGAHKHSEESKKKMSIARLRQIERDASKYYYVKLPSYYLWEKCKLRARSKHIYFDLKVEDVVIPKQCPVFNIELKRGKKQATDNSPSIDRIDNSKGYTKDNIAVISYRANRIKNNATLEDLKNLVVYMEKHRN